MTVANAGPGLLDGLRARASEMARDLEELVNTESPSDDLGLLAVCAERVEAMGNRLLGSAAEIVDVEGRLHLVWRLGHGGRPDAVLIGHYDTVWPAGTIDRWRFSVDGQGRASGPGAFDMKAGIVQMFHALSLLDLDATAVTVLLTADEELGSQTSRALIESEAEGARAALVCEPSAAGALKIARKGTSMYQVHVVGRSAHAGLEPERGVNATVEMAHQTLAIAGLGRPEVGTTVTPTVAGAGTTTNTVPAAAVLHVDARASTPAEQVRVDEAVKGLRPVLDEAELRIEGGINRPPLDEASSRDLMDRVRRLADVLGLPEPKGVAVGGGSDGNFTAGIGVPTLDGLGADGNGAHAEGEYVVLAEMPARAALLGALVADLASQDDQRD